MNLEQQLFDACKEGKLKQVKSLIEHGVDIHTENDLAFRWASKYGHLNVVKYLIENGADVHIYNDYALYWAANNGYLEIVKYLIEQGADIHENNDAALRLSAENGHLKIVKYLIERGANIHANNYYALRLAVIKEHLNVVNYLFSLYENKKEVFKIILESMFENNFPMVKKIIDNYDLDLEDNFLEKIKDKHYSVYNYLRLSKEVSMIKSSIKFDIG